MGWMTSFVDIGSLPGEPFVSPTHLPLTMLTIGLLYRAHRQRSFEVGGAKGVRFNLGGSSVSIYVWRILF